MTMLYSVHLSRNTQGATKASVHAVQADLAGHLSEETGELIKPDPQAVSDALPWYYRKAFERAGRSFWYYTDGRGPATCVLYSTRGHYLNTIYAIPYSFKAGA